jgi:hypothetical protein
MVKVFVFRCLVFATLDTGPFVGATAATTTTTATSLALWIGLVNIILTQALCIQALLKVGLIIRQWTRSRC